MWDGRQATHANWGVCDGVLSRRTCHGSDVMLSFGEPLRRTKHLALSRPFLCAVCHRELSGVASRYLNTPSDRDVRSRLPLEKLFPTASSRCSTEGRSSSRLPKRRSTLAPIGRCAGKVRYGSLALVCARKRRHHCGSTARPPPSCPPTFVTGPWQTHPKFLSESQTAVLNIAAIARQACEMKLAAADPPCP